MYCGSAAPDLERKKYIIYVVRSSAVGTSKYSLPSNLPAWHSRCDNGQRHGRHSGIPHRALRRSAGLSRAELRHLRCGLPPLLGDRRLRRRPAGRVRRLSGLWAVNLASARLIVRTVSPSSNESFPHQHAIDARTLVSQKGDFYRHNSVSFQISPKNAPFVGGLRADGLAGPLLR